MGLVSFWPRFGLRENNCSFFCKIMLCWNHLLACAFFPFRKFFFEIRKETLDCVLLWLRRCLLSLRFHPFTHRRCEAYTLLPSLRYSRTSLPFLYGILDRYYELHSLHLDQV